MEERERFVRARPARERAVGEEVLRRRAVEAVEAASSEERRDSWWAANEEIEIGDFDFEDGIRSWWKWGR